MVHGSINFIFWPSSKFKSFSNTWWMSYVSGGIKSLFEGILSEISQSPSGIWVLISLSISWTDFESMLFAKAGMGSAIDSCFILPNGFETKLSIGRFFADLSFVNSFPVLFRPISFFLKTTGTKWFGLRGRGGKILSLLFPSFLHML